MNRYFRFAILSFAGLLSLSLFSGCANVHPAANVLDPVPVFVGDFGIHSGLFLPTTDGRFVEYAFGDWRYAAENKCLPHDAVIALAASPGSAFGRRYHDCKMGNLEPCLTRKPYSLQRVDCERADVYALIDRLDARYNALVEKKGPPVRNEETGVEFVRGDGHYSILNNCNHLTAQSLRELGCQVSGVVVWSKFRVTEAEKPVIQKIAKKAPEAVPGWTASIAE